MSTTTENLTGEQIVELCRKHTLFEWSVQSAVDPIPVARSKGIYFWTPEGKRFIDFNSQLMCVNIGHGDERVINAIKQQAETLAYANPFMATDVRARLSAKLAEITPGDIDAFFFTNGGAEANENAIRIARMFTGRHKIGARYRSYHGGTAGSLTLTGDPRRWAAEPGVPGVFRIPDFYHGIQKGMDTTEDVLSRTEEVLELEGPKTIAALIVEPVVGTNGVLIPPDGYMQGLRKLCDKHGILLIADEIQTGFARTGKLFAIEHAGIEPDLMTVAKSIAGGVPLSAVIGKADIMDAPVVGGLGGTFAGSPLACAAGLAVLEVIEKEKLNQRAEQLGGKLVARLKQMQAKFNCIGDVRALGMMVAMELVKNRRADAPDADLTKALVQAAGRRGLILLSCGIYSNVIRILAPLTIPETQLEEGMGLLEQSLVEATTAQTSAVA